MGTRDLSICSWGQQLCALLLNVRCVSQGAEEVGKECVNLDDCEEITFPNECLALNPLSPKILFLHGIFKCNIVRNLFQSLMLCVVKEFWGNLKQDI